MFVIQFQNSIICLRILKSIGYVSWLALSELERQARRPVLKPQTLFVREAPS